MPTPVIVHPVNIAPKPVEIVRTPLVTYPLIPVQPVGASTTVAPQYPQSVPALSAYQIGTIIFFMVVLIAAFLTVFTFFTKDLNYD
jgi:hypothetical protein